MTATGNGTESYAAQHALRHMVATLAYRASKVLRDAPAEFATFAFSPTTRLPVKIVAHMGDLMAWGGNLAVTGCHWLLLAVTGCYLFRTAVISPITSEPGATRPKLASAGSV
jgi:hypothetical protein